MEQNLVEMAYLNTIKELSDENVRLRNELNYMRVLKAEEEKEKGNTNGEQNKNQ